MRKANNFTTFICRLSWNLRASTYWNLLGLPKDCFTFHIRYHVFYCWTKFVLVYGCILFRVIMVTCLLPEWGYENVRVLCPQPTGTVTRSGTEILIMLECIINALFAPVLSTISLLSLSSWDKAYRLHSFTCVSEGNSRKRPYAYNTYFVIQFFSSMHEKGSQL